VVAGGAGLVVMQFVEGIHNLVVEIIDHVAAQGGAAREREKLIRLFVFGCCHLLSRWCVATKCRAVSNTGGLIYPAFL
jgi:hypothetical protein